MEKLRTTHLQSAYGRHQVLTDVNLSVESGQIMALVGANGCGKSTLLQILSGLRRADAGTIMIDGVEADRVLLRQAVGYVAQEATLVEELNVMDNLALWYQDKKELRKALQDGFLHDMGVDEMCRIRVSRLSGGMKKKVSIGCALAGRPQILLLDEPDAALDLPGKNQIRGYLRRYCDEGGTVLIATHDEGDLDICDSVYALSHGETRQIERTLRGETLIKQL